MSTREKWQAEYNTPGIPSSFRTKPSASAIWFRQHLPKTTHRLLDLGCGRGRNARYFANEGFQVDAIDWVAHDIESHPNLTLHTGDLTKPFPFPDTTFDAIIDIFCFKHITHNQQHYLQEVHRILKPNGLYLLNLATTDDGYYGPLLAHSPDPARNLARDPHAGVDSILFTEQTLTQTLAPLFSIQILERRTSTSPMHGQTYQRSMFRVISVPR